MEFLYDDSYTGPRYRYGLSLRPLGNGTPNGWIIFSNRDHPRFKFGTVEYPRELTPFEVHQFDMEPVPGDEDIPALISTAPPVSAPPTPGHVVKGARVVRKADCRKSRPLVGIVSAIKHVPVHYRDTLKGWQPRGGYDAAVVDWTIGNRRIGGNGLHRSTIKVADLVLAD